MSFLPVNEPSPELSTTRTGGRSARLIALAVAAVLVIVVYIGVSQRAPTSNLQPTQPAVAVAPTPTPIPTPAPTATPPLNLGGPLRILPDVYSGAETIAQRHGAIPASGDLRVNLVVGGHRSEAALAEVTPRHLHAAYRVPLPAPGNNATLELFEPAPYAAPVQYGAWDVPLNMTSVGQNVDMDIGAYAPTVLLFDRQAPDPSAVATTSVVVRNGYELTVSGARIGNGATVIVDLEVGAKPTYPNESYSLVLRASGRDYRSDPASLVTAPGYARGAITMTSSIETIRAPQATVTLLAGPANGSARSRRVVGTYTFPMPQSSSYKPPWFVASPVGESKPSVSIETSGYTLSITIASEDTGDRVFWTLTVKPASSTAE